MHNRTKVLLAAAVCLTVASLAALIQQFPGSGASLGAHSADEQLQSNSGSSSLAPGSVVGDKDDEANEDLPTGDQHSGSTASTGQREPAVPSTTPPAVVTRELQQVFEKAMRGPDMVPSTERLLAILGADASESNAELIREALAPWKEELDLKFQEAREYHTQLVDAHLAAGNFTDYDPESVNPAQFEGQAYSAIRVWGKGGSSRIVVLKEGESPELDDATQGYGVVLSSALASIESVSSRLSRTQN